MLRINIVRLILICNVQLRPKLYLKVVISSYITYSLREVRVRLSVSLVINVSLP